MSHTPSLELFFCLPSHPVSISCSYLHLNLSPEFWTPLSSSWLGSSHLDIQYTSRHLTLCVSISPKLISWYLCLNLLIPQFPYFIKWQLSSPTYLGKKLWSYPKFWFSHTFYVWFLRTFCASTFKIYSESTNFLPSLGLPSWINPYPSLSLNFTDTS